MWDLPRPGLKPVSPALAGGLLTKSLQNAFLKDLPLQLYLSKAGEKNLKSLSFHIFFFWIMIYTENKQKKDNGDDNLN